MKKLVLFLLLGISLSASAETISNLYANSSDKDVYRFLQTVNKPRYSNATVTVTNIYPIPAEIQQVGAQYTNTLISLFGPGTHTNKIYTYNYVAIVLQLNTNVTERQALILEYGYRTLLKTANQWGEEEQIWDFPYGQSSYTQIVNQTQRVKLDSIAEEILGRKATQDDLF